jgi:NitT/TauT family transport system permease protein
MQPGADAPTRPAAPSAASPGVSPAKAAAKPALWRSFNWRGLISVAAFFLLWQCASSFQWAGFKTIPGPYEVLGIFFSEYLFSAVYWKAWLVSFERVLWGWVLAQIIGIPLGVAFGFNRTFNHVVFPIFEILRPIPPLAWVPLSILFWPTTEAAIIFITFIGAFFIIAINVYEGVRNIRKEHLWLASSLGASRGRIIWRVVLPALIPSIAVGMTLGIAVTWNVVIAAEMIASDTGLGRLTWEGYVSHTASIVVIGMISIGLAGYVSTLLVDWIERRMMPWKRRR